LIVEQAGRPAEWIEMEGFERRNIQVPCSTFTTMAENHYGHVNGTMVKDHHSSGSLLDVHWSASRELFSDIV
jgi:hypothetical protein